MSSKNTLLLTNDHSEHFYEDGNEEYESNDKKNPVKAAITLEFDKDNIRIDYNDMDQLIFTITNVDSEIYKIFSQISKLATKEQK